MAESLKEKTARGMMWSAVNNGSSQVLNLVIGIFLARLLSPAEYGIVGLLTIFTLVANNLQQAGFTQGLINIKHPTSDDYNSVFWFNVLMGVVMYAVLWLCAPLIARFFHQPVLVSLSRFVFLVFLIMAFGVVPNVYLTKNLMNREMAIIGIVSLALSGATGITMAFNGYSYWSLAWQQVVFVAVQTVLRYYFAAWRPSWHISFGPVRRMMGFSMRLLVTNIINTLSNNVLTFIFGRMFPIKDVGNFSQANKWNTLASSFVTQTVNQLAQTVLVTASGDRDREKRVFRKMLRFTAFLAFPCMLGLALIAPQFIVITIGDQWADSIPLLQILCVAGAFTSIQVVYQSLVISGQRSDVYMWTNIAQIVLQIGVILAFAPLGMTVMVIAYAVFITLWVLVWHAVSRRLVGTTLREMARDLLPYLLTAVGTMALTGLGTAWIGNRVALLVSRIVLAALLYGGTLLLLRDDIMREALAFLKARARR